MKKIATVAFALILGVLVCKGQDLPKFNITGGVGLLEAFHIGCKVQVAHKNQIGFYYGNALITDKSTYSAFIIDHQFHFGKVSEYSERPVWFFRQGISYSINNDAYIETKYLFLGLGLGREFNISSKFGISVDLGAVRTIMEKERIKDPSEAPWIDIKMSDLIIFPSARIQLFYRL